MQDTRSRFHSTAVFGVAVTVLLMNALAAEHARAEALVATADSYIRDGSFANSNFGLESTVLVKTASSGYNRMTMIRFNTAGVGAIGPNDIVTLDLWGNNDSSASIVVSLWGLFDVPWSETTVTDNNFFGQCGPIECADPYCRSGPTSGYRQGHHASNVLS